MPFNPAEHTRDALAGRTHGRPEHDFDAHGFMVDKKTGRPLGLIAAPPERLTDETEFPKYVTPHDAHVQHQGDHVSTPHFPEFHVDRAGLVTVLVHDAEQEAFALADPTAKPAEDAAKETVEPPIEE